ncbi:PIN domain-containing protein [Polaromonas sp.]|uniref:PIN domain-containing protein n=1 Tax=Polaromonas sp. TaxID=1869339 RepID=UPI003265FD03
MAGAARYTAILDANVLYPAFLRDVLLSLAHADLYNAKWTATIEDEWTRSLLVNYPGTEQAIARTADAMRRSIPDCMVTGYEPLIGCMNLSDPDDRHVLAAAVVGHADVIVTLNRKDFPPIALAPFDIELQTPDEFIVNQITLGKIRALTAIKQMRERWDNPAYTPEALIELFDKRGLGMSAASLADAVHLL